MSYNDDAVKAKLKSLNETQESIVTVAQWVMFHRRYSKQTAQIWLQRMSEANPAQRVSLIYLANEVAQQAKARKKDDFVNAFAAILPDGIALAMKGASPDIQTKLRRVVEVWRQRSIFDPAVQDAVEARIAEFVKQSTSSSQGAISQSVPSILQPLVTAQSSLSKAQLKLHHVGSAQKDFNALMSVSNPPDQRVHAAKVSTLVKQIASAESAVSEVLGKRQEIIASLERLLDENRSAMAEEQSSQDNLKTLRDQAEAKRAMLEESILKDPQPSNQLAEDEEEEIARPEMERFTPPPVEALTPPAAPLADNIPPLAAPTSAIADTAAEHARSTTPEGFPSQSTSESYRGSSQSSMPAFNPTTASSNNQTPAAAALAAVPATYQPINGKQSPGTSSNPTRPLGPGAGIKRRKTSDDEFDRIGFGAATQGHDVMEGLDEDVVGMLG